MGSRESTRGWGKGGRGGGVFSDSGRVLDNWEYWMNKGRDGHVGLKIKEEKGEARISYVPARILLSFYLSVLKLFFYQTFFYQTIF